VQHGGPAARGLEPFVLGVGAQGHTEHWPPLLRAANRGDAGAVDALASKASVGGAQWSGLLSETAGSYGHGPLHRAALRGHAEAARRLLALRGEPEARDAEGLTPLFLAAFSGHVPVVEVLLTDAAAATGGGFGGAAATDPKGARPLQWAATQGHLEVVEALAGRFGADPAARDSLGGCALAAAATMGHGAVVTWLLQLQGRGREVSEADQKGITPLHWASLHGHIAATSALLEGRAQVDLLAEGRSPLDLAAEHGRVEVVQMLRKAGAVDGGGGGDASGATGSSRRARRRRSRRRGLPASQEL